MPRRLSDLKELGVAWAEKTKGEEELAAWHKIQDAAARVALKRWAEQEPALKPRGDRPICPCGKVEYPTKKEALTAAAEAGLPLKAYICPLGHAVYHLKSPRSERRGGLR